MGYERAALRVRALGPLAAVLFAAAGCHTYTAIPPESARPDEEVQVRFTDAAAVRLAQRTGTISPMLEGRVSPWAGDSLALSLWIGRNFAGTAFADVRQVVAVARDEVLDVRRREISPARSALAATAVIGVFALLIDRVFLQEDPNPGPGPPPPPPPTGVVVPVPRR